MVGEGVEAAVAVDDVLLAALLPVTVLAGIVVGPAVDEEMFATTIARMLAAG
jgi:hypothetical protein